MTALPPDDRPALPGPDTSNSQPANPVWSMRRIAVSSVAAVALATLGGVGLARAADAQPSGQLGRIGQVGPGLNLPGLQQGHGFGIVPGGGATRQRFPLAPAP